tara:strand:- start:2 stop:625 length:624 start_codon:yes stop_codon:yes gene_type:complete
MFKKILLILILSLFQSTISYSNIIEVYCLITKSDLRQAKIAEADHTRFLGKTIKLAIGLDESIIINNAENVEEDQTNLLVGIIDFVRFNKEDIGEFVTGRDANKKTTNTISYKNEITIEDNIKYNYNNTIRLINNVPVSIILKVDQSGLSFNAWNTDVDCKGEDYSADERAKILTSPSSNMPEWFPTLEKIQTEKQQQKNIKRKQQQ